jgi:pathogenesis-related protein 1
VAINVASVKSAKELVAITKKNAPIVLDFKKRSAHNSRVASHLPSLAALTDGSPMAKAFLDAHNAARALHGVAPLVWDNALAAASYKYAAACVKGHSDTDDGENLYYTASSGKINVDDPAFAKSAVDSWYSEQANWDYATSAGKGTGSTGHFTQVVWKGSAKLGCGVASCPNILIGGKTWPDVGYVVCRYTPSGNWDGEYAANIPKKK